MKYVKNIKSNAPALAGGLSCTVIKAVAWKRAIYVTYICPVNNSVIRKKLEYPCFKYGI